MKRIAFLALTLCALGSVLILLVLPRMRADAEARLEHVLVREPYLRVKQGDRRVNVMRGELLRLLASDEQCIANLREINFSSVDFSSADSEALSALERTSTINFYCCKNADSILPSCSNLPLVSVGFELTKFSPQSVKILGEIPTLFSFLVEQNLDSNQVAAMKLLPNTITIRSSFPMDAYD